MLTSRPIVLSLATFICLLVLLVVRDGSFLASTPSNDAPRPKQPSDGYRHDVELVVASMKNEDTSWIQKYLPDCLIFIHASRFAWHNDDPDYDALPTLRNFRISHLQEAGYANLRCVWVIGCPAEIRPVEDEGHTNSGVPSTKGVFRQAWHELMMPEEAPLPEVVGVSCCSQFGVTRETIRSRPVEDYVRFRDWLLRTPLEDSLSGRVLEFSWHIIFGKEAVHCPSAQECYCKTFGICNTTCSESACDGRYTLPPSSTLPDGWPRVGWEHEERNFTGPLG
ncbi:hypothetical protein DL764_004953 [Monosporascus ibericus]|uniref:Uncharacterized protein n=1 Tax=Monosporascus ibericus TaxID=155417 RepID=A0A4Q4TCM4_9PEZI|nr:hypothetical protein DL764_004953 [Monosporascus ibericus]